MKKIIFLLTLLSVFFGYAQPTTDPTTPPVRDAGDVISMFSGAYSNVNVTNFDPNWGQSGHNQVNSAFDTGSGNLVLAYPNFNYQGTEFDAQNASSMEFLHVDIWTTADPGATTIQISPINDGGVGEVLVTINHTAGVWTSVDIPKSSFTGMTWNNVIQMKFAANGAGSTVPIDLYVDNMYFWKTAVDPAKVATLSDLKVDGETINSFGSSTTDYTYEVPTGTVAVPQITSVTTTNVNASTVITQASGIPGDATVEVTSQDMTTTETYTVSIVESGPATAAPNPPARNAGDVISIFSDAYSNISVDTFDTNWCSGTTENVMVGGNETKKVSNLGCEGIEFITGRFDPTATGMQNFHMDFYTENADLVGKVFNLKISNWDNTGGETNALELPINTGTVPAIVSGSWVSIDVPLSAFSNNDGQSPQRVNDFVQFIITSNLGTVYYDNLYFYKGTPLSTEDFELESYRAFPNPTTDAWTIKTKNSTISTINIFNILGKQVLSLSPNSKDVQIDASRLKAGVYFAQIETLGNKQRMKLVKN